MYVHIVLFYVCSTFQNPRSQKKIRRNVGGPLLQVYVLPGNKPIFLPYLITSALPEEGHGLSVWAKIQQKKHMSYEEERTTGGKVLQPPSVRSQYQKLIKYLLVLLPALNSFSFCYLLTFVRPPRPLRLLSRDTSSSQV